MDSKNVEKALRAQIQAWRASRNAGPGTKVVAYLDQRGRYDWEESEKRRQEIKRRLGLK